VSDGRVPTGARRAARSVAHGHEEHEEVVRVLSTTSRARVARRIAAAAAYGGGGIGLLGGAVVGVLFTEAALARHVVGSSAPIAPRADGRYGAGFAAPSSAPASAAHATPTAPASHAAAPGSEPPLRLALLGDSTAAGQGVRRARETPGALLASGLAAVAERPVDFVNVANPGAQSSDLARQVGVLLGDRDAGGRPVADARHGPVPDVCVIMIGANDVTHRMPPALSVRLLASAVSRLRDAGCEVVVGTCPDLGTIEPVYQPLRWVARRLSRQLAAAQTIAVVGLGGRTVSLGDLLGPEFEARPREMFGPDSYHPSAEGYATAAMAILPTVCSALGVWPGPAAHTADRPEAARGEGYLPVDRAAAEAASEGGTEVTAAPAGPRSRWAVLKRRRHAPDRAPGAVPGDPADRPAPVPGHADVA
jgi:lysophospholipase L1-like esterase